MKSMLIVFFIAILFLLFIMFPFKLRMMSHTNLIEMNCFYCFKFWRIKLLCGKAQLSAEGKLKFQNSNNLFSGDIDKNFAKELSKEVLEKIDIKKIELFFKGGFIEDSYVSALVCGGVKSAVQGFYAFLSQKYENVKMYEDVTPTFYETNFELTFDIVISVSLLQILISIIKANRIKKKKLEVSYEG